MPRSKSYVCPASKTARYCKKTLVTEREMRLKCARGRNGKIIVRSKRSGESIVRVCRLKPEYRTKRRKTMGLSVLKPKGN